MLKTFVKMVRQSVDVSDDLIELHDIAVKGCFSESTEFLLDVVLWRKGRDWIRLRNIINRYILIGSPREVNLEGSTRSQIVMHFDSINPDSEINMSFLDAAVEEVTHILRNNTIMDPKKREEKELVQTWRFPFALAVVAMATMAIAVMLLVLNFKILDQIESSKVLVKAEREVQYYDEALTMSTRMSACTGDLFWEERYLTFIDPLDAAFVIISQEAPDVYSSFEKLTFDANIVLIDLETQAFIAVANNDTDLATTILAGGDYVANKAIFINGLEFLTTYMDDRQNNERMITNVISIVTLSLVGTVFFSLAFTVYHIYVDHSRLVMHKRRIAEIVAGV